MKLTNKKKKKKITRVMSVFKADSYVLWIVK